MQREVSINALGLVVVTQAVYKYFKNATSLFSLTSSSSAVFLLLFCLNCFLRMDLLQSAFLTVFGQGLVQLVTQRTSSKINSIHCILPLNMLQICTLTDVGGSWYIHFHCRDEQQQEIRSHLGQRGCHKQVRVFRRTLPFTRLITRLFDWIYDQWEFYLFFYYTEKSNSSSLRNQQKGSKHWTCSISKYCLSRGQCQLQRQQL